MATHNSVSQAAVTASVNVKTAIWIFKSIRHSDSAWQKISWITSKTSRLGESEKSRRWTKVNLGKGNTTAEKEPSESGYSEEFNEVTDSCSWRNAKITRGTTTH